MKAKKMFVPVLVGVIILGLGTGLVAAKITAPTKVTTMPVTVQIAHLQRRRRRQSRL